MSTGSDASHCQEEFFFKGLVPVAVHNGIVKGRAESHQVTREKYDQHSLSVISKKLQGNNLFMLIFQVFFELLKD